MTLDSFAQVCGTVGASAAVLALMLFNERVVLKKPPLEWWQEDADARARQAKLFAWEDARAKVIRDVCEWTQRENPDGNCVVFPTEVTGLSEHHAEVMEQAWAWREGLTPRDVEWPREPKRRP